MLDRTAFEYSGVASRLMPRVGGAAVGYMPRYAVRTSSLLNRLAALSLMTMRPFSMT